MDVARLIPAQARGLLPPPGAPRAILGVQAFLLAGLAMLMLGIAAGIRIAPDYVLQGLVGLAAVSIMVLAGPRVTFPLYYATWIDSAFTIPGSPLSLNQLLGAGFMASWLWSLFRRRLVVPPCVPLAVLALFTVYAVGAGALLRQPGAPLGYQQLVYLVTTIAVASTFRSREDFLRLVAVLLAITCALSSVGLWEWVTRRDVMPQFSDYPFYANDLRINGLAKNAIQHAFMATWMIPWAILLHTQCRTMAGKAATAGAVLLLLVSALLTYNRQTPIIIGAMMVAGIPMLRYRHRALILGGMAVVGLLAAPLVVGRVVERLQGIGGEGRPDASFAVRSDKVTAALGMIEDHPWLGVGLNNFKDLWYSYKVPGEMYVIHFEKGYQHFVDLGYLQIVTETGLVGLALFVLLAGATARFWLRWRRRSLALRSTFATNALAAALMGFVQLGLSMMLQDTFFTPRTYLLFGMLLATVLIARSCFHEEAARARGEATAGGAGLAEGGVAGDSPGP